MHWTDEAQAALAKAPFFVRGMITRRVEEFVRGLGRDIVTLADMKQVRAKHLGEGSTQEGQMDLGEMSADQIEKIVRSSSPQAFADERTYEVRVCGLPGCPRRLFDVNSVAEKMVRVIEESRVPEAVVRRVNGPVLRHHRLMVSISGCPNSCSQPQIADFGVQGRARPVIGSGDCTGCESCVNVCREDAVTVSFKEPVLDTDRCVDCGDCASVCPTQALIVGEHGFTALAGGKLGRNPQLAQTLFGFTDEKMLLTALRVICEIFVDEMEPKERVADAVNRIGVDEITRRCTL